MPISILAPAAGPRPQYQNAQEEDGYASSQDLDGMDLDGPSADSNATSTTLLTPGTLLTSSQQFMRGHGTFLPSSQPVQSTSDSNSNTISSSLLGTLTRTNKLLSITPLSSRYVPEIGDLVVGRIVEVQPKRWRVDVAAARTANLPLSAINLPGGVQRKRTAVDELNMRLFFSEGDVLVAEVQQLGASDGSAGLHTRSLRYGKLRNGVFVDVGARRQGRAVGVKRSKRHIFTLQTARGELDVIVGVNGYVFVALPGTKGKSRDGEGMGVGVGRDGEQQQQQGAAVSGEVMYSCQNDLVPTGLRVEISRLVGCIRALVERGVAVDEEVIRRAYDAAVEVELEEYGGGGGMDAGDLPGENASYLGGERGRLVVDMALKAAG